MANAASAIGGGVRSPRSSDLGSGPRICSHLMGAASDEPAGAPAASAGAGVRDARERRQAGPV